MERRETHRENPYSALTQWLWQWCVTVSVSHVDVLRSEALAWCLVKCRNWVPLPQHAPNWESGGGAVDTTVAPPSVWAARAWRRVRSSCDEVAWDTDECTLYTRGRARVSAGVLSDLTGCSRLFISQRKFIEIVFKINDDMVSYF